eukprot:7565013-Alexandrium_andersonii.AAC.1
MCIRDRCSAVAAAARRDMCDTARRASARSSEHSRAASCGPFGGPPPLWPPFKSTPNARRG